MTSILTRLKTLLGATPSLQSFEKIGIVTEGDDFTSDKILLQYLSDNPINRYVSEPDAWASAEIGSNQQYRFDFTLVYLGFNGPKRWLVANGLLYSDSDALIVVFDPLNPWVLDSLRLCLELSAKGAVNSKPNDFYPTVKKGIPWLVLANFKEEPLDEEKAREQVKVLKLDTLDVDWHLHAVSTASGAGIDDAASVLRKKLDEPGSKW
ncbi:uncharacterized protein N7503_003182 [Penicillium pulvis]|uniref:uncharacterized protein n=1 Tax=Penicillium pulvis TaxID=1562058 RepID=UPI002546E060|nr:uncharacterized protein N7503_003182 [Penicillium pulvis]KAJ5805580.1 hypothetical protein N7503_003182 [Penicillium pulvis]